MALDSEQAFRIFLASGLPQAYTYSKVLERREARRAGRERDDRPEERPRRP